MNLISKKDLLAFTGISYGQLYRWKRERLIPEEWFLKQSSYTGQETFFPREQILSRVQSILELKDKYSLEELAEILSPKRSSATVSAALLETMEEIDKELLEWMTAFYGKEQYDFTDVAFIAALSEAAKKAGLTRGMTNDLISKSVHAAGKQKSGDTMCTIFIADGEYHTAFIQNAVPIAFDSSVEVVAQFSIGEAADKIKIKYTGLVKNK